jgi:hypothetical protein
VEMRPDRRRGEARISDRPFQGVRVSVEHSLHQPLGWTVVRRNLAAAAQIGLNPDFERKGVRTRRDERGQSESGDARSRRLPPPA